MFLWVEARRRCDNAEAEYIAVALIGNRRVVWDHPFSWVMAGITRYYSTILLRRAGIVTVRRCLTMFAEHIAYRQQPKRLI